MLAKDLPEDRVEGTHMYLPCHRTDMLRDTCLHLACRLVGEGQSHQSSRMITRVQQIEELVDEDASLTTPCSSDDQSGTIIVDDSGTLSFVEFTKVRKVEGITCTHCEIGYIMM